MKNQILLIQPPYKRAAEIPYGTIPALTAALRSKGYHVLQRDLNVEILLSLLDKSAGEEILNSLIQKRTQIDRLQKKNSGIIKRLKQKIVSNPKLLPLIQKFYLLFISRELKNKDKKLYRIGELNRRIKFISNNLDNGVLYKQKYIEEVKQGKISSETHQFLRVFYREYTDALNLLTSFTRNSTHYFDLIDNSENNRFYSLYEDFMNSIIWDDIKMVGITVAKSNKVEAFTLAALIRRMFPEKYIVMGGELFRHMDLDDVYDQVDLKEMFVRYVDGVVLYEGETAIVKLAECVFNGGDFNLIPNLVRLVDNNLKINQPFYMEKISELPQMDFEGMPVEYYPGFPVEISRGCYWSKCSFCRFYFFHNHSNQFEKGQHFYRPVPIQKIIDSVRHIKNTYNKNYFEFVCLDISPPDMEKLCKTIIDNDLNIRWGGRLRLEKSFKAGLFDLMAKAGVFFYILFPETLSQRTADLHHKNYNVDHVRTLINYWQANKERLPALVIKVFTAFPGETFKDFKDTYRFIMKGDFGISSIGRFGLSKHSQVYDQPEKYGIQIIRYQNKESIFDNYKTVWQKDIDTERKKIERFLILHKQEIDNHIVHWKDKWKVMYED